MIPYRERPQVVIDRFNIHNTNPWMINVSQVLFNILDEKGKFLLPSAEVETCFFGAFGQAHKCGAQTLRYYPQWWRSSKEELEAFYSGLVEKHFHFAKIPKNFETFFTDEYFDIDLTDRPGYSFWHVLTTLQLLRYPDDFPEIVREWCNQRKGLSDKESWVRFANLHRELSTKHWYAIYDHALFSKHTVMEMYERPVPTVMAFTIKEISEMITKGQAGDVAGSDPHIQYSFFSGLRATNEILPQA